MRLSLGEHFNHLKSAKEVSHQLFACCSSAYSHYLTFSPQSIPPYYHFLSLPAQCFPEGKRSDNFMVREDSEQTPVSSQDIVQSRS